MESCKPKLQASKRNGSKKFLKSDELKEIFALFRQGMCYEEIAKKTGVNVRAVTEHIYMHNRGQVNQWTPFEDTLLIKYYKLGMTRPARLSRILTAKAPWMIRNRIKNLKKKNILENDKDTRIDMNCNCPIPEKDVKLIGLETEIQNTEKDFLIDGLLEIDHQEDIFNELNSQWFN